MTLRRLRLKAGYHSPEQLAEEILVCAETVRRWERGQTAPPYCIELYLKTKAKGIDDGGKKTKRAEVDA